MNLFEEVKKRVNILDVVNDFGIKVSRGNFISSIYKDEKNPSLKLYPSTNSYYDFSSGKGGDVIDFFADKRNIDLRTAIHELANELNIGKKQNLIQERKKTTIPTWKIVAKLNRDEQEYYGEIAGYLEYCQGVERAQAESLAYKEILKRRVEQQKFIYESLAKCCDGVDSESLEYLTGRKRGLSLETIEHFKLFSIRDVNKSVHFLEGNFSLNALRLSGLFNEKNKFVFWKHRIIIPYIEGNEIVYLRGRYLENGNCEPSNSGKYISLNNSAGNLISKRFFNKDILKDMKEDYELMICEGEFDSMIANQAGYKAVGIPGVTNFPKNEIELIERFRIYLAFDGDEPGQKAIKEIAKLFNKTVFGIKLKKHKDLTEFINDEQANKSSAK